ncbi:MAG: polyprenol monophosphomannose synthase [Nitrososphaerales archaeon]
MQTETPRQQTRDQRKRLCLVIPTLNERDNITNLLTRMKDLESGLPFDLTLLVVDDNSDDGTAEVVKETMQRWERVKIIQRPAPAGIGSAYLEGFRYGVRELKCDYLGEMDADLQHPPEALVKMCETAREGVDVVIASRYVAGGGSSGWSFSRRVVSRGANFLSRIFIRSPVADTTSGFRVLSARAIVGLLSFEMSGKGFAFQVESLYIYKKLGMSFAEVPYVFQERQVGKTKLRVKELLHFAYVVLKVGIFGVKRSRGDAQVQDSAI